MAVSCQQSAISAKQKNLIFIFSGESAQSILHYRLTTRDSPPAFDMTVVTPTKRVPRKGYLVLQPEAETYWGRAGWVCKLIADS